MSQSYRSPISGTRRWQGGGSSTTESKWGIVWFILKVLLIVCAGIVCLFLAAFPVAAFIWALSVLLKWFGVDFAFMLDGV